MRQSSFEESWKEAELRAGTDLSVSGDAGRRGAMAGQDVQQPTLEWLGILCRVRRHCLLRIHKLHQSYTLRLPGLPAERQAVNTRKLFFQLCSNRTQLEGTTVTPCVLTHTERLSSSQHI